MLHESFDKLHVFFVDTPTFHPPLSPQTIANKSDNIVLGVTGLLCFCLCLRLVLFFFIFFLFYLSHLLWYSHLMNDGNWKSSLLSKVFETLNRLHFTSIYYTNASMGVHFIILNFWKENWIVILISNRYVCVCVLGMKNAPFAFFCAKACES